MAATRAVQWPLEAQVLMSNSILLLPFIFAFLAFVFRFYSRESASSMANPSFLLALGTVMIAVLYLVLGILSSLPPYSTLGFGLIGLILLGVSILRMFML
jgi:quinol-cytochrome oxidoreductase complex cytochrome b subunit